MGVGENNPDSQSHLVLRNLGLTQPHCRRGLKPRLQSASGAVFCINTELPCKFSTKNADLKRWQFLRDTLQFLRDFPIILAK